MIMIPDGILANGKPFDLPLTDALASKLEGLRKALGMGRHCPVCLKSDWTKKVTKIIRSAGVRVLSDGLCSGYRVYTLRAVCDKLEASWDEEAKVPTGKLIQYSAVTSLQAWLGLLPDGIGSNLTRALPALERFR